MTSSYNESEGAIVGESGPKGTLPVSLWVSNRQPKHLTEVRAKSDIPVSIMMRVLGPKERVVCCDEGEISFFEDVLHAKIRFPFS